MRVHLVDKITCFVSSPRIRTFHYDMFHGLPERGGVPDPHDPPCYLGGNDRSPLVLMHNAYKLPAVFSPSCNLVVSDAVRSKIAHFPNIEFLRVEFKKLIWLYYQAGDFSGLDNPPCEDPLDLFKILPGVAGSEAYVGPYFELLRWRLRDIAAQFEPLTPVEVAIGRPGYEDEFEASLSADLVRAYPICWAPGATILSEEAFELLSPHLDRDYYATATVEL